MGNYTTSAIHLGARRTGCSNTGSTVDTLRTPDNPERVLGSRQAVKQERQVQCDGDSARKLRLKADLLNPAS
jgi:hypothetical protein